MSVLTCYVKRRRIGAYLDGALPETEALTMAAHLGRCPRCQREAEALGSLREMVRAGVDVAEPDWTGFWPGIVRGIEAGARIPDPVRPRRVALGRRVAVGGVLAALLAVTIWHAGDSPVIPERVTAVTVADTGVPGGGVMVYSPPEDDMTVIWIFDPDNQGAGSVRGASSI